MDLSKIYDETRYVVLFGPEIYGEIYDQIQHIISEESDVTYIIIHIFAKSGTRFIRFFTSRKSNDF